MSSPSSDIPGNGSILWNKPPIEFEHWEVATLLPTLLFIWCTGCVANFILVLAIWRNNNFHSPGYILMASLAMSETVAGTALMLGAGAAGYWYYNPTTPLNLPLFDWFGLFVVFSYNCVVFNMFAISANRFCAVIYFQRYQSIFTTRRTLRLVYFFPFVSFLLIIVQLPGIKSFIYTFQPRLWMFIVDGERAPYGPLIFIIYNANGTILVAVMITFYVLIIRRLKRSQKVRHSSDNNANAGITRENRLLTVQFSIVTAVFLVSWIALGIYEFVVPTLTDPAATKAWTLLAILMWRINYSVNPLVYVTVNRRLRRCMVRTMLCKGGAETYGSSMTNYSKT